MYRSPAAPIDREAKKKALQQIDEIRKIGDEIITDLNGSCPKKIIAKIRQYFEDKEINLYLELYKTARPPKSPPA